ncbi:MAG TPA: ATP-binding protein, partial [Acidobacteriota bacterium]|nr:ATP-binding protein [Acidobacteriota bacterium]
MNPETLLANAQCIQAEIAWFREFLEQRLLLHAEEKSNGDLLAELPPPALIESQSPYAETIQRFEMGAAERLVLILALIPHVKPGTLDPFFIQNQSVQRRFTEFGGLLGMAHGGFLPTAETAMFLLAGDNIHIRLKYHHLFHHEHFLYAHQILSLDHRHQEEPPL